uniref:Uncharacterized protein n=1 Tax=Anopheles dirus TaxID=7168 RepID=A0A182NY62_9DIPT
MAHGNNNFGSSFDALPARKRNFSSTLHCGELSRTLAPYDHTTEQLLQKHEDMVCNISY